MELENFLKRMNLKNSSREPSLELLRDICMSMVSNIPFETLDMFGGKRKVWDLPTIYQNIVEKKKGGFCYELNGILQWALKLLGYEVELLKGFPHIGDNVYQAVSDHLVLLVSWKNGEKYLTDVGWGGSSFVLPLLLKMGIEQTQPNGVYRLSETEDMYAVEKKKQTYLKTEEDQLKINTKTEKEGAKIDEYGYKDIPWNIVYGAGKTPCTFDDCKKGVDYAQDENVFLQENSIVVLQNESGRKFLLKNLYYEKKYVDPNTLKLEKFQKCSMEEVADILKEEFGIILDFELKIPFVE